MKLYVIINIILCFSGVVIGQNFYDAAVVQMGSKSITIEEPFVISLVLRNAESRPSIIFPEINGLEKRGKSVTSSVSTVDGEKVIIQTISQEYFAQRVGKYQIPEFYINVNGVKIRSEATTVSFNTPINSDINSQSENDYSYLPELDFNNDGVFLSVQTDKKSVFLREGFALRVSLYIAEDAPVEMEFYQPSIQLQSILKKIRPTNCWEENAGIEEIVKRQVRIGGKKYTEYNMYQAQLFPITIQDIIFPTVNLEMLVLENKSVVNVTNKVLRSFHSKASRIQVRPLPEHPLKDQVAVGQYSLVEKLSRSLVYPGESVRYVFEIHGVGNIAAIPNPDIDVNAPFDFYPSDASQVIKRSYSRVSGQKTFDYFVVPRKDGTFPLNRYFRWIYFDPVKVKYDTLKPARILQVRGDDFKLGNISLSGSQGLYDDLESLDTTQERFNYKVFFKDITNAIVVILLIAMIWVIRK